MKNRYSRIVYFVCSILMLYAGFVFYPKWNQKSSERTIGWDVSGYYWYLPATFIYQDLKHQAFGDSIIAKYNPTPAFEQSYLLPNGNRVNTYSSGMAVMYLPAFATGHTVSQILNYPTDGFSTPYQLSLQIWSTMIALIGLWYYRKLMLQFFSDKVVALLLFLLVVGTNYLNYSAIEGAQTHNFLFVLYVFLLLNTINFYRTPSYKYAARIGLLCGLLILTRPSEIISILIPLLWGLENFSLEAIKSKGLFLKQYYKALLLALICVLLLGSIQVIYWLYVAGKPFVFSYVGKTFTWLPPHTVDYMFSFRSGWVTYTPMIFLVLLGIVPFIIRGKNKVAILVFFALNLYIVSAWDIWWYGGTGGRAMLQSYPVILFPFATLLELMFEKKWLKWLLAAPLAVFTYFNLWFTYNAHAGQGLYDADGGMTSQYYWRVVFRYKVPMEVYKLKDADEIFEGKPHNMKLLYTNNFETDTNFNASQPVLEGSRSFFLNGKTISGEYGTAYKPSGATWIRAQATFRCMMKEWSVWQMPQMVVSLKKGDKVLKDRVLRMHRYFEDGGVKNMYLDVHIPKGMDSIDNIKVHFWNEGSDKQLIIDNLKIWSFKE